MLVFQIFVKASEINISRTGSHSTSSVVGSLLRFDWTGSGFTEFNGLVGKSLCLDCLLINAADELHGIVAILAATDLLARTVAAHENV